MFIQTVNGKIEPNSLGITLPHEHVIIDYRASWIKPEPNFAHLATAKVSQEIISDLRLHAHNSKDNLVLDDVETAVEELVNYKNFGGNAVIELSTTGLSIDPLKLREISIKADVHIIAASGYYLHYAQAPETLVMQADEIEDIIVKNLLVGIGDSRVRAGIIGEVGTSYPLHPFEEQSLIASAKAQQKTGFSINVHPEILAYQHLNILNILEKAGADLSRVVLSHMDEPNDIEWILKVAERNVYISFDTFGYDFPFDGVKKPSDLDRINCLLTFLEKGYIDKTLLSHDICYKMQQRKFGGPGYSHILKDIVPILKERGVSDNEIQKILVENPKRLLSNHYDELTLDSRVIIDNP